MVKAEAKSGAAAAMQGVSGCLRETAASYDAFNGV